MAVTEKLRAWFEREYGYSLRDAFEVMRPERLSTRKKKRRRVISPEDIDAENEELVEALARTTGKAR